MRYSALIPSDGSKIALGAVGRVISARLVRSVGKRGLWAPGLRVVLCALSDDFPASALHGYIIYRSSRPLGKRTPDKPYDHSSEAK